MRTQLANRLGLWIIRRFGIYIETTEPTTDPSPAVTPKAQEIARREAWLHRFDGTKDGS